MMFVTSYYLKYHTWPKVEHPNILPESLCSYYNTNTWPTSYGYKRIALEDWDQYPVKKLIYKTDFSLAEIISDKALAVPAETWYQSYDNCVFSCLGQRKPYYNYQTKRVLENYLTIAGHEIKMIYR